MEAAAAGEASAVPSSRLGSLRRAVRWPAEPDSLTVGPSPVVTAAAAKLTTLLPAWPRRAPHTTERPPSLQQAMEQSEQLLRVLNSPPTAPPFADSNYDGSLPEITTEATAAASERRTWKEAAQRNHGKDGYHFGDLTRLIAASVGGSGATTKFARIFGYTAAQDASEAPGGTAPSPADRDAASESGDAQPEGVLASLSQMPIESQKQWLEAAARDPTCAHIDEIRNAIRREVLDAARPTGAALTIAISRFLGTHSNGQDSKRTSSGAAFDDGSAVPTGERAGVIKRIVIKSGSARPGPDVAAAAAAGLRHEIALLEQMLLSRLPPAVAQSVVWSTFARTMVEGAMMRGCWGVVAELFAARDRDKVSRLAELCHQMRFTLPCDTGLPPSLWAMPSEARVDADALERLRCSDLSDARLPYAPAIRTLRTLLHARTAREKATILLDVCEQVAGGAQHSAQMFQVEEGSAQVSGGQLALGAEDLLPIVAYVVLRSRVSVLPAEIDLIAELMPSELAFGGEGYALTTMQCACHVLLSTRFCEGMEPAWQVGQPPQR